MWYYYALVKCVAENKDSAYKMHPTHTHTRYIEYIVCTIQIVCVSVHVQFKINKHKFTATVLVSLYRPPPSKPFTFYVRANICVVDIEIPIL